MKCPLCGEPSISWFRVILCYEWAMFRGFSCGHCGGRFRRHRLWTHIYGIIAFPIAGLSMVYAYMAYKSSSTTALIAAVAVFVATFAAQAFIPWVFKR